MKHGFVRERPAPTYGHQRIVGRLFQLLIAHVQARCLGDVVLSPMDVVVDKDDALIVQPDLMFISWFVDERDRRSDVVDCERAGEASFAGTQRLRSQVLPEFAPAVDEYFP